MNRLTRAELIEMICFADATCNCNQGNCSSSCDKCEDILNYLLDSYDEKVRADAIKECKYNVELFREVFLEELERQAIDREEIFMYRNICSMAWNKYLEQLKEQEQKICPRCC